jgi:hypothetical protein
VEGDVRGWGVKGGRTKVEKGKKHVKENKTHASTACHIRGTYNQQFYQSVIIRRYGGKTIRMETIERKLVEQ